MPDAFAAPFAAPGNFNKPEIELIFTYGCPA
jgi:hypothetical protein